MHGILYKEVFGIDELPYDNIIVESLRISDMQNPLNI